MPQQALGCKDEQRERISLEQRRLTPQDVEVLGGGRAVDQTQVDIRGGFEKPLGTGVGMLRSLPLVAMRQEEYQRGCQAPFGSTGSNELIEHDLRAVDEVAVLRFPDHQTLRFLHVVTKLEPDCRVLGKGAVVNLKSSASLREFLQWYQLLAGIGIMKHRVAMAERAAFDVFAGDADRDAVGE